MKVLVTAASRHGATTGIAEVIAHALNDRGLDAEARRMEDVSMLASYDAVVLGSAIYYGHWLKQAVEFTDTHVGVLSDRPLWLFSSGPVEEAPSQTTTKNGQEKSPIRGSLTPQGHKVFRGSLHKSQLGRRERAVVRAVHGEYGDFRDWDDVRAWADGIADTLTGQTVEV